MPEQIFFPNMEHIRVKDPKMWETLRVIQQNLQSLQQSAPPQINGIAVSAANGFFTVAVTDNGDVGPGIHYFFEHSTTPGFEQPIVIDNGASRTGVFSLGNQTLFWRAYSQYISPFSPPNAPLAFGNPTGVAGGGAVAPPAVTSTGSGTAATNGQQGGSGFGKFPVREPGAQRLALL